MKKTCRQFIDMGTKLHEIHVQGFGILEKFSHTNESRFTLSQGHSQVPPPPPGICLRGKAISLKVIIKLKAPGWSFIHHIGSE